MDYIDFKNGPAGNIFTGLGEDWAGVLGRSKSFEDLRHSVVDRNDRDHGRFAARTAGSALRAIIVLGSGSTPSLTTSTSISPTRTA
jgi:hypothetical protein